MRVPNVICKNVFKTYQTKRTSFEKEKLISYNFAWEQKRVKALRNICLETIKDNWKDFPFYSEIKLLTDRQDLAEILPCNLELNLTVPIIDDDFYWERCYKYSWPESPHPIKFIKNIELFYFSSHKPHETETNELKNDDEKEKPADNLITEKYENLSDNIENHANSLPSRKQSLKSTPNLTPFESQTRSPVTSQKPTPSKHSEPSIEKKSSNASIKISSRRNSETSRKMSVSSRSTRKTSTSEQMRDKIEANDDEMDEQENFVEVPLLKTWKTSFLEKYFREKLQNLDPSDFNQEMIRECIDLVGDYIYSLKLDSLKAANPTPESPLQCNDHIPLDIIVGYLPNLFELCICFNEANLGDNFSWNKTSISERDCKLLGNGLEKSDIKIFRIIKSNINCTKLELLLHSLVKNSNLRILDLSHGKIGDDGVEILVQAFKNQQIIESLILVNNKIGPKGAEYLSALLKQSKNRHGLINLNIKLNHIGNEGCNYLTSVLSSDETSLKSISLSSCEITGKADSLSKMLVLNNTIEKIDLSNNNLGQDFADILIEDIQKNITIVYLDLRMCNISAERTSKIDGILQENWSKKRGQIFQPSGVFEMPFSMV